MSAFNLNFKVEGLDTIKKTFRTAKREADAELKSIIREQVNRIRDLLRERAPKRTGTLEKAIISRMGGKPGFPSGVVRITHGKGVRNDAYYWHFVEFGTAKSDANPFIVPVLESERSKVMSDFRDKFFAKYAKNLQAKTMREASK